MKKLLKVLLVLVVGVPALLAVVYFLGPKASYAEVNPDLPTLSLELSELEEYISGKESLIENIKPENASRIVWADSIRQTEYALVYLHGFSAGPMEGAPMHTEVARRYGMNLYLPRLSKHGIQDDEIFMELTPEGLMESAKEALAIGKMIGEKVIVMSCSTGGTLGIYLGAHHSDIHAQIFFSPNINLFDDTSDLMTGPWGLQIVKQVVGDYREPDEKPGTPDSVLVKTRRYWSGRYRVEGLVALQALLDQTMTEENFAKVSHPYMLGYYYKSDSAQDSTVSVKAMHLFDELASTPENQKRMLAFPEAGSHVINSDLTSKSYDEVREATFTYVEEVLGVGPVN